ncbi:MAG: flagellar protein FliS [Desulfovibrio sp.]|nr:flagellar protein FliS [Desulfovibrio sp.]
MSKTIRTYFGPKQQDVCQGQMVVNLYDVALRYLSQARDQMVAQKFAERSLLVDRAQAIIAELTRSIDVQSGGDLAVKLNNLYLLCSSRLLAASQTMRPEDLDSVVSILTRLRDVYIRFLGIDSSSEKNAERERVFVAENGF